MLRLTVAAVGALLGMWLLLALFLLACRPSGALLRETLRLLPDLLRLLSRLARDRALPRRLRWPLWATLAAMTCS